VSGINDPPATGILLERLPGLDLELIRSTLTMIEDALGQSDLRPLFERELTRRQGKAD
jgi:hypothetical protein